MRYHLALVDKDRNIVAQMENGALHSRSGGSRVLDKNERREDGSLLGRKGETISVPHPIEDPDHVDNRNKAAFDGLNWALVDDQGRIRAIGHDALIHQEVEIDG